MTRRLTLRREHLAELADTELAHVAAGDASIAACTLREKLEKFFETWQATRCFCP